MNKLLPLIIAAAFAGASLNAVAQGTAPAASGDKMEKSKADTKSTTKGEKKGAPAKKD